MKIALFVDQFPKLSETFIVSQIDGLLDHGHEVVIFPCRMGDETRVQGLVERRQLTEMMYLPREPARTLAGKVRFYIWLIKLTLFHAKPVLRLRAAFGRYRCLGSWQYALTIAAPLIHYGGRFDVIFAHFGPNGLRACWYRDAGVIEGPLVTVFHGFDLSTYIHLNGERIYDPLFQYGDLFLPISHFWQDRLRALGCPADKIKVHHVGVDCEQFRVHGRVRGAHEPTVLISVARLVEKKGIEYAIRAMAALVALDVDVRYRIIGDGPLAVLLQQITSDLHLGDHVSFLGTRTSDEVAGELAQAHLFIAPSVTSRDGDMEGIPTVLMEAMATGLPVISTSHSGIPELVEDGISGKLVGERDVDGLAQAIRELVARADDWPAMGMAGREKVLREFNIERLNGKLERLFEGIVRDSSPR